MHQVQSVGNGLTKGQGNPTTNKEHIIVDGDGICPMCCGIKRHSVHCKVICSECGTILVNCNGD